MRREPRFSPEGTSSPRAPRVRLPARCRAPLTNSRVTLLQLHCVVWRAHTLCQRSVLAANPHTGPACSKPLPAVVLHPHAAQRPLQGGDAATDPERASSARRLLAAALQASGGRWPAVPQLAGTKRPAAGRAPRAMAGADAPAARGLASAAAAGSPGPSKLAFLTQLAINVFQQPGQPTSGQMDALRRTLSELRRRWGRPCSCRSPPRLRACRAACTHRPASLCVQA